MINFGPLSNLNWWEEEKNYKLWKESGYLDGLEDDLPKAVASEFTHLTNYLENKGDQYLENVYAAAYAVIRRIFENEGGPNKRYSHEAICKELDRQFRDFAQSETLETIKQWGIDYEASTVSFISFFFSKNYENAIYNN